MTDKTVDKKWFEIALEDRNKNQADLARHLDIDKSAMSRILSGGRKLKSHEAASIAQFLSVPIAEVLKHAGLSLDIDGQPTRILLAAIINEAGKIDRLSEPRPLPQALIDKAHAAMAGMNGRVVAAQVRAAKGPLAVMDDAIILFGHTDTVEPDSIGVLAICRLHDGEQILAKIERARKTGEAHIVRTSGEEQEVILHTATPVIAILP